MVDQFVLTTTQEALALDCLRSSHAIQTNVNDPRQIEGIHCGKVRSSKEKKINFKLSFHLNIAMFDTISYKKVSAQI